MYSSGGVAKLFPKNPVASSLMTAADEQATTEIEAVSAACLMARRAVVDQIHGFDPRVLPLGQDMDFCWRVKMAGGKVYHPDARLTHVGWHSGTGKTRLHATIESYRAWIFHRKHRKPKVAFPERPLVYSGIALKTALSVATNALRRSNTPATANPQ